MFSVGDKIVYPMYGAGIVKDIEQVEIDGKHELYYVIVIPSGNLTIRLSAKKSEQLGLRAVSDSSDVLKAMEQVAHMPVRAADNWNQRYKENMEKIKTGQLIEVAEVVRNLILRERERGLSSAEKKMLNNARQIILSEIVFSSEVEKEEAEKIMLQSLLG